MTAPRFFTFLLWLTNSQFALSQAQRRLLAKVATAAFPVRNAMQILRCRFSGVLICLLSPGVQVLPLSLQPSISNCGMLDAAWPTVCCAALRCAVLCCAVRCAVLIAHACQCNLLSCAMHAVPCCAVRAHSAAHQSHDLLLSLISISLLHFDLIKC